MLRKETIEFVTLPLDFDSCFFESEAVVAAQEERLTAQAEVRRHWARLSNQRFVRLSNPQTDRSSSQTHSPRASFVSAASPLLECIVPCYYCFTFSSPDPELASELGSTRTRRHDALLSSCPADLTLLDRASSTQVVLEGERHPPRSILLASGAISKPI